MAFKTQTVDYQTLLKNTSISDRVSLTGTKLGQQLLAGLTPTEIASLFPEYYKRADPDVSGFLTANAKRGSGSASSGSQASNATTSADRRASAASGAGKGTSRSNVSGGSNKEIIQKTFADELRRKGVPTENIPYAVAALSGQIKVESNFNPTLEHDNRTGYGIYGARDPQPGRGRKTDMFKWLEANGYDKNSAEGQSRFMVHEAFSGKYPKSAEALRGATKDNLGYVTTHLTNEFEAPKERTQNIINRTRFAQEEIQNAYAAAVGGSISAASASSFSSPVDAGTKINSGFGPRNAPMPGASTNHQGIDFQVAHNTPIRSSADGVVLRANPAGGYGYMVEVQHADGIVTRYAHLSKFEVKPGDQIRKGQTLGLSGGGKGVEGAGNSTGPHLHYEVRQNGQPIDPKSFLESKTVVTPTSSTPPSAATLTPPPGQETTVAVTNKEPPTGTSITPTGESTTAQTLSQTSVGQRNAVISMGTNDHLNPAGVYQNAMDQIARAKTAGLNPVLISPNPKDPRTEKVAEMIAKAAKDTGARLEVPQSYGDGLDPDSAEYQRLGALYRGSVFSGDSVAVGIGAAAGMKIVNDDRGRPVGIQDESGQIVARSGATSSQIVSRFGNFTNNAPVAATPVAATPVAATPVATPVDPNAKSKAMFQALTDKGDDATSADFFAADNQRTAELKSTKEGLLPAMADGGEVRGVENTSDLSGMPIDGGRDDTMLLNKGEPVAKINSDEKLRYDSEKNKLEVTPKDRANADELVSRKVSQQENYNDEVATKPMAGENQTVMKQGKLEDTAPYMSQRDWVNPVVPTDLALNDTMSRYMARNNFKEDGNHYSTGASNFST